MDNNPGRGSPAEPAGEVQFGLSGAVTAASSSVILGGLSVASLGGVKIPEAGMQRIRCLSAS